MTKGVPTSIVTLGNLSLLAAMGEDETLVTREFVEAARREILPRTAESMRGPASRLVGVI